MFEDIEISNLKSQIQKLRAQIIELKINLSQQQNNQAANGAWVNNIPTHFTPIPMAGGGGGGGLHPFKVRTKKSGNWMNYQIWLPPNIVYYNDEYLDPYNMNMSEDGYWYDIDMYGESGERYLYLRVYKNEDGIYVYDVSLDHIEDDVVELVIAIGDQEAIEDDDGNTIMKSAKITQLITSAMYLDSMPKWVSPN